MEYVRLGIANYRDPLGDIFTLWEFLDQVWRGNLIPSDGCIGSIIIDGYDTDLFDREWMTDWGRNGNFVTLKELTEYVFEHGYRTMDVRIRWCNK